MLRFLAHFHNFAVTCYSRLTFNVAYRWFVSYIEQNAVAVTGLIVPKLLANAQGSQWRTSRGCCRTRQSLKSGSTWAPRRRPLCPPQCATLCLPSGVESWQHCHALHRRTVPAYPGVPMPSRHVPNSAIAVELPCPVACCELLTSAACTAGPHPRGWEGGHLRGSHLDRPRHSLIHRPRCGRMRLQHASTVDSGGVMPQGCLTMPCRLNLVCTGRMRAPRLPSLVGHTRCSLWSVRCRQRRQPSHHHLQRRHADDQLQDIAPARARRALECCAGPSGAPSSLPRSVLQSSTPVHYCLHIMYTIEVIPLMSPFT